MVVQKIKRYIFEKEFRKNRVVAILTSLFLHSLVILGLLIFQQEKNSVIGPEPDDLNFGSSGGGGAEEANKNEPVEFGAQQPTQEEQNQIWKKSTVQLIQIQIQQDLPKIENAMPVPIKEKPKAVAVRRSKPRLTIIAENLPIGHTRHGGEGPGGGGGTGGGEGGRRLLSGRIPVYPSGQTDKQMTVILQFTVLADGSVGQITPVRRTD